MNDLATRFERNVDRSGDHHRWTGAVEPSRGTGRIKVRGKTVTANRVAWELANGPLPATVRVTACPDDPACVRLEHLRLEGDSDAQATITDLMARSTRRRAQKGGGSMREVRPGVWKFSVPASPYTDGTPRRAYRTVRAASKLQATRELAAFVDEVARDTTPVDRDEQSLTMDEAMRLYLEQHLREEKGREDKTIRDYWKLHAKWFAPEIGAKHPREVDEATLDRVRNAQRRGAASSCAGRNS